MNRRRFLIATSLAAMPGLGWPSGAVRLEAAEQPGSGKLLDRRTVAAIARGLKFLKSQCQDDGSFRSEQFSVGGYSANVGVCGIAGMAMMAAGSTPARGPHGREVKNILGYVLKKTSDSGYISARSAVSHGPMYGHGFATLFLAECYGMSPREDLRTKLGKAVKLIIGTQNDQGGWRYEAKRADADISVTVCQVMALRAARNAGIYVPTETIERAIRYISRCQNADGGFMYMKDGGESLFPRSAAGVVALYSAGIYEGPRIEKGLGYLVRFTPGEVELRRQSYYFYGHYYAVQAMWHAGGNYWLRWYPKIRSQLLAAQKDNGSWTEYIGSIYATAMACIILQMPNNYLPIFQR